MASQPIGVPMTGLREWLEGLPPGVAAAVISAVIALITTLITLFVAPIVKYAFDKRIENRKLDMAYRFEQRKALKDHLAKHRGRFLEAADDLNYRLWNFRKNEGHGWMYLNGRRTGNLGYYPTSFAYRILYFLGAGRSLEREAFYIDVTVATPSDFDFLKAVKLNKQVWTDVDLFQSLPYDRFAAVDHLFKGTLVSMVESGFVGDDAFTLAKFEQAINGESHLYADMFEFLDGIQKGEGRYRRDRLTCVHLVLVATLNSFGYDFQKTELSEMRQLVAGLEANVIAKNLETLIRRIGLDTDAGFKQLLKLLSSA